ncbi:MAG: AzlD domain-containing protein [Rhodocyclales bacterium]|nr:AzlD domain-containing protein [Rhodocyclales bacterium]
MAEIATWAVIAALAAATFATRLSFLALFAHGELPAWLRRVLHYVPPAVLAAIVTPQLLAGSPGPQALADGPRVAAALLALAIAYLTRSALLTIILGMAALWGLRALLS